MQAQWTVHLHCSPIHCLRAFPAAARVASPVTLFSPPTTSLSSQLGLYLDHSTSDHNRISLGDNKIAVAALFTN